jgi:hypothetical protein
MIEIFLLYIKKNLSFLWKLIELVNRVILKLLFFRKFKNINNQFYNYKIIGDYQYRLLRTNDIIIFHDFFSQMDEDYLKYFNPHKWDERSLSKIIKNNSIITLGFFLREELVGYFFLRMFFNKRAFIGRLVSEKYKGKGIAKSMAKILYHISSLAGFNVYSTISKDNVGSLKSHMSVNNYTIIKELPDNYYLIKFNNSETFI